MTLISAIRAHCSSSREDSGPGKAVVFVYSYMPMPKREPKWKLGTVALDVYGFHNENGSTTVVIVRSNDRPYSFLFEVPMAPMTFIYVSPYYFIRFSADGENIGLWREDSITRSSPSYMRNAMDLFKQYVRSGKWAQEEFLMPRPGDSVSLAYWAVKDPEAECALVIAKFVQ